MRYNLLFLLFYFLFASSIFGQNFPNTGTHGSATTLMTNQGAYSARAYIPMSFLDTTQANLNLYIKNYPGALVRTSSDGIYWKRSIDGKKWEQFGSGGTPTLQQVFDVENADAQFDKNNDIFLNGTRFRINGAATGSFYTEELAEYYHSVDDGNMPQFVFREYPNGTGGAFAEWSSTGGSPVNAREVGIFFQSDSRTDSTTQITIHSGSVPNQAKNGQSATSLRIRPQGIRFFLRNDIPKNFQIVNPSITSDTAWKFMGYNPSDSSVRVFSSNGIVAGVSGWGLTGNSGTLPPSSFIGTTDNKTFRVRTNNNEVARFDSLGARFFLYGGTNPILSMRQNTSLQEYQFRIGVGTGLASQAFNLFEPNTSRILTRWNGDVVSIGNTTNPYMSSALYVWGKSQGANIDAQADSTILDDGNIEVMDPDYSDGNGIAIEYLGRNGVGTTMGYSNRRLGKLRFHGDFNLISVTGERSLRFGINDIERMTLDSTGKLGIGVTTPKGLLHAQGADTIFFNGSSATDPSVLAIDSNYIFRGQGGLNNSFNISAANNNVLKLETSGVGDVQIFPTPGGANMRVTNNSLPGFDLRFVSGGATELARIRMNQTDNEVAFEATQVGTITSLYNLNRTIGLKMYPDSVLLTGLTRTTSARVKGVGWDSLTNKLYSIDIGGGGGGTIGGSVSSNQIPIGNGVNTVRSSDSLVYADGMLVVTNNATDMAVANFDAGPGKSGINVRVDGNEGFKLFMGRSLTGPIHATIYGDALPLLLGSTDSYIRFQTNGTDVGRWDASGNLSIGTQTAAAQLHTTGSVRLAGIGGAGTVTSDADGDLSVTSDGRLKNIFGSYRAGLKEILQLQPMIWEWKHKPGVKYAGFDAKQVNSVMGEYAAPTNKDGFNSLQDRALIAALVTSVKELNDRIEKLEAENKAIKNKLK